MQLELYKHGDLFHQKHKKFRGEMCKALAIIIIGIYTYTIGSKVDKIYSILDTERVNVEIDTNCN